MVQRAQAIVDQKQIDVNDTVVRAPDDGIVTKVEQLQVGDYMQIAAPVFSLMSDRVWVEANFKETELTHMRAGQEATISVDTYPDAECHGQGRQPEPRHRPHLLAAAAGKCDRQLGQGGAAPAGAPVGRLRRYGCAAPCRAQRHRRGRYETSPALAGLAAERL